MKRFFLVLTAVLFLAGCAAARETGFYEHDSLFKNWEHMKFSIYGYKQVSPNDVQKSWEDGWWGITVEVPRN